MSGKPPFYLIKSAIAIIRKILKRETPSEGDHHEIPKDDPLWNLMRKCWAYMPLDRPPITEIAAESADLPGNLVKLSGNPTPLIEPVYNLLVANANLIRGLMRNKHQAYHIITRARDIVNYIIKLADAAAEETADDQMIAWERSYQMINSLEIVMLELAGIFLEEPRSFGVIALESWQKGRSTLLTIRDELYSPPFHVCQSTNDEDANQDALYDDCAWLALTVGEGIEQQLDERQKDYDSLSSDSERVVLERLRYLVSEVKMNNQLKIQDRESVIQVANSLATSLAQGQDVPGSLWQSAAS
ncbi:hypothetical protein FRC00_011715 [Tulasnella sp. 408]|nr:hypothetical protein FRC00_011715 [Tulasnella sp. 408]